MKSENTAQCRRNFLKMVTASSAVLAGGWACARRGSPSKRPNVLFILLDDMNDWVGHLGGHPQVKTPNMDRLAAMGTTFTNAHSNNPVCAPSRASLLSGYYPHTSGMYSWGHWEKYPVLAKAVPMFKHFKDNGYDCWGSGKLHHYSHEFYDSWGTREQFVYGGGYGPFPWHGGDPVGWVIHPDMQEAIEAAIPEENKKKKRDKLWNNRGALSFGPLSQVPEYPPDEKNARKGFKGWSAGFTWPEQNVKPFRYVNDDDRDLMPDESSVDFAIGAMKKNMGETPFCIGVGIIRPHAPLYAPKKYFDMYPLDKVQLPPYLKTDLEDIQKSIPALRKYGFDCFDVYDKAGGELLWKKFVQAYLACVSFADAQVGRLLDALEETGHLKDTVTLLTSDHGFNCGEKDYIFKGNNWEDTTRVPFIVHAPGVSRRGGVCNKPVSLVDVYPTLCDLAGIPGDPNQSTNGLPLDGHSVRPLLENPRRGKWDGPDVALTLSYASDKDNGDQIYNYSVRSERWRYIMCANDAEELYDHNNDEHEWVNLAYDPEYAGVKAMMKRKLLGLVGDKLLRREKRNA